ncbi:hypothetical protein B0H21DRAFT_694637 [Amylocystis lapponica]|nr:hypothetical protein B0H21DRAFT_694637 [Amylocystis lapponica]
MALDPRGDISVVEIIIYIPILIIGVLLVMRHGFSRKAGWIFLVILSLMRLVGGITHILSETSDKSSIGLKIAYGVCESAGTSPLLLAALGFLAAVGSGTFDNHVLMNPGLRLMGLCGMVAVILSIVGGVKTGDASSESDINLGLKLRRVGACLYIVLFAFNVLFGFTLYSEQERLSVWKRKMLIGVMGALPFLLVRVIYTILSAFAPATESIAADGRVTFILSDSGLSKFSATSGSWVAFLVMSLLMEYIVVVIYAVTGLGQPVQGDIDGKSWESA